MGLQGHFLEESMEGKKLFCRVGTPSGGGLHGKRFERKAVLLYPHAGECFYLMAVAATDILY